MYQKIQSYMETCRTLCQPGNLSIGIDVVPTALYEAFLWYWPHIVIKSASY